MDSLIDRDAALERSDVLLRLRRGLENRGFIEVHSPVLVKGGVNPQLHFQKGGSYTMRDCMELRLRSALALGLQRVYEIGPCFRLGDSDDLRHPEFYMLETFGENLGYGELVQLARGLFSEVGRPIDQMQEISVEQWIKDFTGLDPRDGEPSLLKALVDGGYVDKSYLEKPLFRAINHLIDQYLEAGLRGWTLLKDFPKCTVCLAKPQEGAEHLIERFEIFWNSIEVAHGFVDHMDDADVEKRMHENGPEFYDAGFLRLLRSGRLPQSGGLGIGIERLLMALGEAPQIHKWIHLKQF